MKISSNHITSNRFGTFPALPGILPRNLASWALVIVGGKEVGWTADCGLQDIGVKAESVSPHNFHSSFVRLVSIFDDLILKI